MPRNARYVLPGTAHHITQRGNNRQDIFFSPADRELYLTLAHEQLADTEVTVLAFCLMTNHVHWIVVPHRADSLAVLFRRVHGRYAQCQNILRRQVGHFWQARYFSCPLSPGHLDIALRYVEQNPVRANMVDQPGDYLWSSAAVHLSPEGPSPESRLPGAALLDRDCWAARGGAAGWQDLLTRTDQRAVVNLLRRCTYGERPFGDEAFLQEVEAKLGRRWHRCNYDNSLRDADSELRLTSMAALATNCSSLVAQTERETPVTDSP